MERAVELINKFSSDGEEFNNRINNIQLACDEIEGELNKLTGKNHQLSKQIIEIFKMLNNLNVNIPGLDKLKYQIKDINENVQEDLELIKSHYDDVNDELYSIGTIVAEEYEKDFKHKLNRIAESIYSIVKVLNEDNSEVKEILDENKELGNQLAMSIQASIEKVKYYDFFEQVIEEIIIELNNIYLTIKSDSDSLKLDDDLESIKERYTMESQRDIHDKILNEDDEKDKQDNEDEEDIEFF